MSQTQSVVVNQKAQGQKWRTFMWCVSLLITLAGILLPLALLEDVIQVTLPVFNSLYAIGLCCAMVGPWLLLGLIYAVLCSSVVAVM